MSEGLFRVSLVVSTYNWPEALRLCLASVARQSVMPDEVIIADDGSTDETRQVIDEFRLTSGLRVIHEWHEDRGFRKCAILNRALLHVDGGNYVILTDGDMILHRHFIKDHIRLAAPGHYVFGRRAYLLRGYTARMLAGETGWPRLWNFGIVRRKNLLRLPWISHLTAGYRRNRVYGIGANLAAWQDDIVVVNGFDEDYEGWGAEDSDLICRLRNIGLTSRAAMFQAVCLHLWHEPRPANPKRRVVRPSGEQPVTPLPPRPRQILKTTTEKIVQAVPSGSIGHLPEVQMHKNYSIGCTSSIR